MNISLVSTKGPELLKIAKENHVKYLFEASVGGGIPIIHSLLNCLDANEIYEIVGEVAFYGKGAGKFPTASAVCSDIIECTKIPCNL